MDLANQPLLRNRIYRIIDDLEKESIDQESSSSRAIAYLRQVRPVAQNGPQCGLVALHMAGTMLPPNTSTTSSHPTVESIFDRAKSMGYTNNGEMFSVDWLADLATRIYSSPSEVIEIYRLKESPVSFFVRTLSERKSILVPYDTDKNHEPCMNNGHTAHWALIIGFVVVLIDSSEEERSSIAEGRCWTAEEDGEKLRWLIRTDRSSCCDGDRCQCLPTIVSNLDDNDSHLFVVALHGKSKHAAVWPLSRLLASNANLREIGPKRSNDGLSYVLPDDGVFGGLNGKVLMLG